MRPSYLAHQRKFGYSQLSFEKRKSSRLENTQSKAVYEFSSGKNNNDNKDRGKNHKQKDGNNNNDGNNDKDPKKP